MREGEGRVEEESEGQRRRETESERQKETDRETDKSLSQADKARELERLNKDTPHSAEEHCHLYSALLLGLPPRNAGEEQHSPGVLQLLPELSTWKE